MASRFIATSSPRFPGALAGVPRYGLIVAAGAPPRRGTSTLMLAVPAGFLACTKRGRLAVVAAAASAPGGSDDGLPSDREAVVSAFRLEMELFKLSLRPMALVRTPTDREMDLTVGAAEMCVRMVDFLLGKEDVHPDIVKGLVLSGHAFLLVESQAKEGYVKADALVNAIQGLKLIGDTFFKDGELPVEYSLPVVPRSAEGVDKDSFIGGLINNFISLYIKTYWEALVKFGFGNPPNA